MGAYLKFEKTSLQLNMVWNVLGSVFYQGCMWLMTILVVRLSGNYENSGILALAMSVGNIYTALGTYNMRTVQISDVTNRLSINNYVGLRILTTSLALLACLLYSFLIPIGLSTSIAVATYLLFKADEAFVNVMYGADQKAMRLDIVGKSQLIRGSLSVALFVIVLYFSGSLVLSFFLIFIGNMVVTIIFDVPQTRCLVGDVSPHITLLDSYSEMRNCLPSVLGLVLSGFIVSSARQFFGITYGEGALGIYASVATPCVIIQVLAQNLYAPLLVPVAEAYSVRDMKKVRQKTFRLLLLVIGIALCISAILTGLGQPLLSLLYGPSIEQYVYLLGPALIVASEIACTALMSDLLIVFGALRLNLVVNCVAFVVNILMISGCTQTWYMNGINISLLVAYAAAIVVALFSLVMLLSDKSHQSVRME